MMLLILAISLTTLTAAIIVTAAYRLFRANHQLTLQIADLQDQLSALCAGAVGVDERILQFEQALNQLKERQHTLDLSLASQHSFDHAIRLARKGVEIDKLIDNCNISDEEAHLISRLHGARQGESNPDYH